MCNLETQTSLESESLLALFDPDESASDKVMFIANAKLFPATSKQNNNKQRRR